MMQQRTSRLLYDYWNGLRNGRIAPHRYEVEPAKIAALLPETFIVECGGLAGYRIRLAGTRICDQFGRELRGAGLLDFWKPHDREALATLVHNVVEEGAVAVARITARADTGRRADFEMTLMPLIHTGQVVNRILGCITAIDPPFWLGTTMLERFELTAVDLHWPDGAPACTRADRRKSGRASLATAREVEVVGDERRRFRVYDGGLSD